MPLVLTISLLALFIYWYLKYRDLDIIKTPSIQHDIRNPPIYIYPESTSATPPPKIVPQPKPPIRPQTVPQTVTKPVPPPKPTVKSYPKNGDGVAQTTPEVYVVNKHPPQGQQEDASQTFQVEYKRTNSGSIVKQENKKMKRIGTGYVFNPPPPDEDDEDEEEEENKYVDAKTNQNQPKSKNNDDWEASSSDEEDNVIIPAINISDTKANQIISVSSDTQQLKPFHQTEDPMTQSYSGETRNVKFHTEVMKGYYDEDEEYEDDDFENAP